MTRVLLRVVAGCLLLAGILFALGRGGQPSPEQVASQVALEEERWKADVASDLEDFFNRPRYEELTVEILAEIPDHALERSILDYVEAQIGEDTGSEREIVAGLSPAMRALYRTWWLQAEVATGGFHQYFWNATGKDVEQALLGLDLFGASAHERHLRQALAIYGRDAEQIRPYREKRTAEALRQSRTGRFASVDRAFLGTDESLEEIRVDYIRTYPEQFTGKVPAESAGK